MNTGNDDKFTENEDLKLKYEDVIALGVWISSGDEKVVSAVWLETVGQFLQAIGVTQQILATNKQSILQAQGIEITGSSVKSFAHALEAIGGIEIRRRNL
ncbi:hypothetical protein [Fictibacillus sp. NRS-1165]|uniref:hypothetical protein n=1 Tax=Fictibacillus sp. NRS-1165 TaxID=3144463 RepID=UPI003D249083